MLLFVFSWKDDPLLKLEFSPLCHFGERVHTSIELEFARKRED